MLALVVLIVAALVAPFAARSSAAGDADRARPVVLAGDAVPGGGTFERFSVESLPIVAPVTSEGRVAFFATILRGRASEGFFVWSEGKVAKVVVDGDRKSTRLNSSHGYISYAVFCLKKKKTNKPEIRGASCSTYKPPKHVS